MAAVFVVPRARAQPPPPRWVKAGCGRQLVAAAVRRRQRGLARAEPEPGSNGSKPDGEGTAAPQPSTAVTLEYLAALIKHFEQTCDRHLTSIDRRLAEIQATQADHTEMLRALLAQTAEIERNLKRE